MGSLARVITTKEATLETVTVEIRVITLNGKQMTLSVFRQLPMGDEKELDEDEEKKEVFEGQPWGIVRYSIKDEGHIWLVFSRMGKLYRRVLNFNYNRLTEPISVRDTILKLVNELELIKPYTEQGKIEIEKKKKILTEEQEFYAQWQEAEKERIAYEENLLKTLPQLFIAV